MKEREILNSMKGILKCQAHFSKRFEIYSYGVVENLNVIYSKHILSCETSLCYGLLYTVYICF